MTDYANITVTAPVMTFSKLADRTTANPSDTIVYTIEYNNSGSGWASLVEIVDTIPADTTFVTSTPVHTSKSGDTYTWFIGDVAPGAVETVVIEVKVNVPTLDETPIYNYATLDYSDANGNFIEHLEDSALTTVTAPILSFTKIANTTTAYPNEPIIYTLEYENSGTGWASVTNGFQEFFHTFSQDCGAYLEPMLHHPAQQSPFSYQRFHEGLRRIWFEFSIYSP